MKNSSSPFYLLLAIVLGAVGMLSVSSGQTAPPDQSVSINTAAGHIAGVIQEIATVVVDKGDGSDPITLNQPIDANSTALDALQIAMQRKFVTVQTKQYDFGTIVDAIDGVVNGTDNQYWIYFVNGTSPSVGADQYVLEPGDTVEFMFIESSF